MINDKIIAAGFSDGYLAGQQTVLPDTDLIHLCPDNPLIGDPGAEYCTIGVTPLDAGGSRRWIDYLFRKNFAAATESSTVIFNSLADGSEPIPPGADDVISDHAGVWVGATLPD